DQPLRRAAYALSVVKVDDGSRMGVIQHVLHLTLGRDRPQTLWLDRPEHAPLAVTAERAEHRGVHHAPGRTEVADRTAGRVGEELMGPADLVLGAARPAEPETPVRPAMAADLVTGGRDARDRLGRPRRPIAYQEERGPDPGAVEHR